MQRAIRIIIASASLPLALSACRVPHAELPPIREPDGPVTLESAVSLAFDNNADLLTWAARLDRANAAVALARSSFWPVLAVSERYSRTDAPSAAFANILDQERFRASLDFNEPGTTANFKSLLSGEITLYDGGRRRARLAATEAEAIGTALSREQMRNDIALEVARAFTTVWQARNLAAIERQSVETLEAHVRIAEAKRAEGAARRSDVLAVRVALAENREASIVADGAVERAMSALHVLLGLSVEVPLELVPTDPAILTADDDSDLPSFESLLARAQRARPELARATAAIAAAQARLDEAAAGYLPDLSLFGSVGTDDRELEISHPHFTWGLQLLQSLTDAARTPQRVRHAAAGVLEALAAARRVQLDVEHQLSDALLDLRAARARLAVAREAVDLASESLRIVEAEYQEGVVMVTHLLDAELAVRLAQTRSTSAAYDRLFAHRALRHAVGETPVMVPDKTPSAPNAKD